MPTSDISVVVHELASITKSDQPTTDTEIARRAMEGLKVAHETTNLRILNAQGKNVADKHFANVTAAEVDFNQIDDGMPEDPQTELPGIVQRATDLSMQSRNETGTPQWTIPGNPAQPAMLWTGNRITCDSSQGRPLSCFTERTQRVSGQT